MKRLVILLGLSCAFGLAASAQRLPENAVPESYDLKFEPNLAKATFTGEETIHLKLARATASITLNSAEIEFVETKVTAGGATQTATMTADEKNESATITVPKEIPAGPA